MVEDVRASAEQAGTPRRQRGVLRNLTFGAVLFAIFMLGGFAHFAVTVAREHPVGAVHADGIVALTGGASRIADAITLLEKGRGQRLLISGVHPETTSHEIARQVAVSDALFNCCVDLDYGALNTVGNAKAAGAWAKQHGFQSLVIVTSAYHMPRSLMEFSRAAPGITFRAYPVHTDKLALERWWADPNVMRVMVSEFGKYLLARLQLRLGKPATTTEAAVAAY